MAKRQKKTHDDFVAQLVSHNKNVLVIGVYTDYKEKVKVKCKLCGHEWSTLPNNILRGRKCPNCSRFKTHDDFVKEASEKNQHLEILGIYETVKKKLTVRCKYCGEEYGARPDQILDGQYHKKCSDKHRSKTKEEFLSEVHKNNPHVTITEDHDNYYGYVTALCTKHNTNFTIRYDHMKSGQGCEECTKEKSRKGHDQYVRDLFLVHPEFTLLSKYTTCKDRVVVRCDKGHVWDTIASGLLVDGCPECKRIKATNDHDTFVSAIHERYKNLEVVGNYTGVDKRIAVRCKQHNIVWHPIAANLRRGSFCPKCRKTGFKSNLPGVFYIYEFSNYLGFGITNKFEDRHATHRQSFNKANVEFELLKTYNADGYTIQSLESLVKCTIPIANSGIKGFIREATMKENRSALFLTVERFLEVKQ